MQPHDIGGMPVMVGDPVKACGGNSVQLRLNGKVTLATMVLHGP
ncbi:Na+/H+ antiporter NhaD or related arsenite permease [Pseudomonas syringae pv. actinidiae]|uniref:Na+/H+ antiporter NhaD or related arsenite permease n=1 Tax=Pseudomonas syringae pv. actinidiae TaxID=103796 RepID=A0A2V0QAP5_PSESF|nr:Na+/H+ antiporter NhaD or related arsenite permease [Pseudomonas syringae pv. actinidiae]